MPSTDIYTQWILWFLLFKFIRMNADWCNFLINFESLSFILRALKFILFLDVNIIVFFFLLIHSLLITLTYLSNVISI